MRTGRARALRQLTLSTGKSAGRNSYRKAARRAIIGHFNRAMSGQFRRNGKIWVSLFSNPLVLLYLVFLFVAPKLGRLFLYLPVLKAVLLIGLGLYADPSLFVIPNLDLAPDTQGNEITLNELPSAAEQIESSASVRARNLQLAEGSERVQRLELDLENERDPGRRRELTARLDQEIRGLERQIDLSQRADSIRDRQIAEWRRRFDAELARVGEESARQRFRGFCLRVLIYAQEDQPPSN